MSPFDTIILGGGIIGCSLAEELARNGMNVAVIERGAIGQEASTAAAGILSASTDLTKPDPLFEFSQSARKLYPRWVRRLEEKSGISVGLRNSGIVFLAQNAHELQVMDHRARWQRRYGIKIERWSQKKLKQKEPNIDAKVKAAFYFLDGVYLDNALLMQALAKSCRKEGVKIFEGQTVRRIAVRDHGAHGVNIGKQTLHAPIIINCLGSWASMNGSFPVRLPVQPVRGQILVFEGPKSRYRHAIMSHNVYGVQRQDGRLLLGSTVEFSGYQKSVTAEGMHDILCKFKRLSSAVNQCRFLYAWSGFRPHSADGFPIIGQSEIDGIYVATGHYRHGILMAPATAKYLSDSILGRKSSFDLQPFSPSRFS